MNVTMGSDTYNFINLRHQTLFPIARRTFKNVQSLQLKALHPLLQIRIRSVPTTFAGPATLPKQNQKMLPKFLTN